MAQHIITDMGSETVLRDSQGHEEVIGRYGVWRRVRNRDEVIEVGNDLDALCEKYQVKKSDVIPLQRPGSAGTEVPGGDNVGD